MFPGEKDSSKQYCLFCLWGEEDSACPDKLISFWLLLHFAIQSCMFGHSQVGKREGKKEREGERLGLQAVTGSRSTAATVLLGSRGS